MSDEEERKLWRIACEQAPDVVRWVETRLRREPQELPAVHIPAFDRTYSNIAFVPPGGISRIDVTVPLNYSAAGGHAYFKVVGMSLWVDGLDDSDLKSTGVLEARIHLGCTGQQLCQPASMLFVPHMNPPFRPGWLVDLELPPASMILAEITNGSLSRTASFRFAIHGSFEAQTG